MYQCPKCRGTMRTYDRNGVHIEQCDNCRGVFLDYGELESLTQMEARWSQPAPPVQGHVPPAPPAGYGHSAPVHAPAWGAPHHGHLGHGGQHGHKSFVHMLFSS